MTTRFSRPSLIALAVSLSALSGGVTQAAEEMDHSAMGHGSMSMDHSQMGHGSAKAPMEGMDHSKMEPCRANRAAWTIARWATARAKRRPQPWTTARWDTAPCRDRWRAWIIRR